MTREQLEARIWAITGRELTGATVDAIIDACEEYAAERVPHGRHTVLHHASGTDLYPVIQVLASALLDGAEEDEGELGELAACWQDRGAA